MFTAVPVLEQACFAVADGPQSPLENIVKVCGLSDTVYVNVAKNACSFSISIPLCLWTVESVSRAWASLASLLHWMCTHTLVLL